MTIKLLLKILKSQKLGQWKICYKMSDKLIKKNFFNDDFFEFFFNLLKELNIKNLEYFCFIILNLSILVMGKKFTSH